MKASVPALTVVAPVYVLAPDRVRVPVPVLVRLTVPEPFSITPAKLVVVLSPSVVSVVVDAVASNADVVQVG